MLTLKTVNTVSLTIRTNRRQQPCFVETAAVLTYRFPLMRYGGIKSTTPAQNTEDASLRTNKGSVNMSTVRGKVAGLLKPDSGLRKDH